MAFYEPLHERLPYITSEKIRRITAGSWHSRHPAMASPYFYEYLPLLRESARGAGGRGVEGTKPEFSFDRFFLRADESHESLQYYIERLCNAASAQGRRPLLKFVRSQGRLPWFRARFPEHAHILLVRQPWAQFASAWRCLNEDRNPYFLAAPFVVLERNTHVPKVAALIEALGLPLAPRGNLPVRGRMNHWQRHITRISPQMVYRVNFALWLLSIPGALPAADLVLDADMKPEELTSRLGAHLGIEIDAGRERRVLSPEPRFHQARLPIRISDVQRCHDIAVNALGHEFGSVEKAIVLNWIKAAEVDAKHALSLPAPANRLKVLWRRTKNYVRLRLSNAEV